ncbi:MAG: trypsin-like serine protease [Pseudobdellovibrionaceae bacterium]
MSPVVLSRLFYFSSILSALLVTASMDAFAKATASSSARSPAGTGPIIRSNSLDFAQRSVQIKKDAVTLCSGYINAEGWVVTAAQCFKDNVRDKNFHRVTVRFGVESLGETSDREISKVIFHPKYSKDKSENDLALVQFTGDLPSFAVKTDVLPTAFKVEKGLELSMAGFGVNPSEKLDEEKNKAGFLRRTSGLKFEKKSTLNQILVQMNKESRACHGDTGAPLMVVDNGAYKVLGIVGSISKDCGSEALLPALELAPYTPWFADVAKSKGQKGFLAYDVKVSGAKPARDVSGLRK